MYSVARINRLFGGEGELSISLYDSFPKGFDLNTPLFARIDGLFTPLYLEKFERKGAKGAHVAFADMHTDRRVMELLNLELYIQEQQEESYGDDQFTLDELIGYSATIDCGEGRLYRGEITEFYDSEMNPLFEISIDGRAEVLIPAVEEFISSIDFEFQEITFTPPEGLIDL